MNPAPDGWNYRVEAYRWNRNGVWQPVSENDADTWFLLGQRGDDQRVFGMFASRSGAEDAAEKVASGRLGEEYCGVRNDSPKEAGTPAYDAMLSEASRQPGRDDDRGPDR